MRFFHLSDLHIGKLFYGYSMLEEQEDVLNQIVSLAAERKPDAVILAGDIYDKSVPAAEAVAVFDRFLCRMAQLEPAVPILIISGNHDSPERLSFAGEILRKQQIYIEGMPPEKPEDYLKKVTFTDAYGSVNFYLMPFCKPAYVQGVWKENRPDTFQDAVFRILEREQIDETQRNVLVSHQFYVSGSQLPEKSDSEMITVGGLDQIDIACLQPFDYVALGHIHRPQMIGKQRFRYCGTPLKYSVSEWNQEKSVTEVELSEKGKEPVINLLKLSPMRDVKVIRGKLEEILNASRGNVCDDYVSITLTDEQEPYQPRERLESVFTHILEVRMDNSITQKMEWATDTDGSSDDPQELFAEFFRTMQGREMLPRETEVLSEVLEDVIG